MLDQYNMKNLDRKSGFNNNGLTWEQWYRAALIAAKVNAFEVEDPTWEEWLQDWKAGVDPTTVLNPNVSTHTMG